MWIKKYNRPGNIQFDDLTRGPMVVNNPYFPGVVKSVITIPAGHGTMDYYYKVTEWDALMAKIAGNILRGPNFLTKHRQAYARESGRYIESVRRLPQDLRGYSNRQLLRFYNNFARTTKRMWLFFYAPWAVNEVVEPYFQKQVHAHFPEHEAFILDAVGGLSQEVRFNIQLKRLLRLKKLGRLDKKALERHAQRWGYLKMYVPNHVPYQPHEFRQMVHGTRVSEKIDYLEKSIRLNKGKFLRAIQLMRRQPKLAAVTELLHWYVYLRNERIDCYREATYHVRRLFQELDHRLGLADCQSSFMTIREIESFLGNSKRPDLKAVRQRSKVTYGWYVLNSRARLLLKRTDIQEVYAKFIRSHGAVDSISGVIAYPGKVTGRVKIIHSHDEVAKFKPGNILVAPMTHPEYIHIMKQAGAFVTDEGGITCHAAIMAREFKKPCVIGTKIATQAFKDGDRVEVDAYKGVVRKI
ncbi:MAG: PEP-utilizing enzyme [Patescibacteria group bacterium]